MLGNRRFARYPIALRLRLQLPAGELETTTDEISLAGFSALCPSLPEVGTRFGFVVHLPDGTLVSGTASAMRISAEGLAGFSMEFVPEQQAAWEAWVAQEEAHGGVWRMIGRYALSSGDDQEAARSVLEKGPLGLLFRRIGEKKVEPEPATPPVMRLHMVGENGEAYRIAFEKHPSDPPERSVFASAAPRVLELMKRTVSRILVEDVHLKRTPNAAVEPARLVEMIKGGYAYVVQHAGGKPGLMGLQGGELIVIEVDGKSVFPFFDPAELEQIAADTFRRESVEAPRAPAPPSAPPRLERFAAEYTHQTVDTRSHADCTQQELRAVLSAGQRVQTRTYGSRTLRMFPDVWLEVRRPAAWPGPSRGFAIEDGPALCVFVLAGHGAPCVVKLAPSDSLSLIRRGSEASAS